jgi:hypothetical protein
MTLFEVGVAIALALMGVRSLWRWARRPFDGTDPVDHALYAAFVTGRVGLWFAIAGLFAIYAYVDANGGSIRAYRWYLLVPLSLAGLQLVGGWFLARRGPGEPAP